MLEVGGFFLELVVVGFLEFFLFFYWVDFFFLSISMESMVLVSLSGSFLEMGVLSE
jgi:hypothetical protein